MDGAFWNVVLGVVSSAVSAALAWAVQASLRRRRLDRRRAFLGLPGGTEALVVAPRKAGTVADDRLVALNDVYALMDLSALVRSCGATLTVLPEGTARQGVGDKTEFCLGGPAANARTAAHLRWKLPGVWTTTRWEHGANQLVVGSETYVREEGVADFVLLARLSAGPVARPAFLVVGQTATANRAAVRYLEREADQLSRRHGPDATFALMLRVVQPQAYGSDVVELVGDVTAAALAPLPPDHARPPVLGPLPYRTPDPYAPPGPTDPDPDPAPLPAASAAAPAPANPPTAATTSRGSTEPQLVSTTAESAAANAPEPITTTASPPSADAPAQQPTRES